MALVKTRSPAELVKPGGALTLASVADGAEGYSIGAAPIAFEGKVIIGLAGGLAPARNAPRTSYMCAAAASRCPASRSRR